MKWFWRILIASYLISLFSCSPEIRMANLVKKHPELAKGKISSDSGGIDPKNHEKAIQYLLKKIDSLENIKPGSTKETEIRTIIEKNIPQYLAAEYPDTILSLSNGTKLRIFFDKNGKLNYNESHPMQQFFLSDETWWEKLELRLFKWMICIVSAFIAIMLSGSGLRILEHHLIK